MKSDFRRLSVLFAVAASIAVLTAMAAPSGAGEDEITAANWTEKTAFKPDLTLQEKAGTRISKKNVSRFARWIPKGMRLLVEKYGLELKVRPYEPVHPSPGYIAATNEYRGKAKIIDRGKVYNKRGIEGHVAGLPFPKPKIGLEIAWNLQYAYGGDDAQVIYGVYWVGEKRGVEHSELWKLQMIRGVGRTDIDPRPAIPSFVKKGLRGAGLTYALEPYDKKGFGAVYFTSITPKDGQGHIYVPSMKRILRNSFGTRGDTWNSTDLLYEDVRGYSGYPEWMYWKLKAKKTVLLPMHSGAVPGKKGAKKTYAFDKWPHWNPRYRYEPRPVYVVEARPKLPDYPYKRQTLYFDAETHAILYKESYDRKGELWKIMINAGTAHRDAESDGSSLGWGGTVVIDLQAEHATVFHVHKARRNVDLDPEDFSLANLRKRGR